MLGAYVERLRMTISAGEDERPGNVAPLEAGN